MTSPIRPVKPSCPKCGSPVDVTHHTTTAETHRIGDAGDVTTQTATCTNEACGFEERTTVN